MISGDIDPPLKQDFDEFRRKSASAFLIASGYGGCLCRDVYAPHLNDLKQTENCELPNFLLRSHLVSPFRPRAGVEALLQGRKKGALQDSQSARRRGGDGAWALGFQSFFQELGVAQN